ncbi:MAG: VWA domain-containing protein [Terriglobales bacterium]
MRFHFSPSVRNKWLAALQVLLLATSSALPAQDSNYVFKVQTEVVLVNVTVRDKSGNLVRNLKQDDFTVLEDGKAQHVISFDQENTDVIPATDVAQVPVLSGAKPVAASPASSPAPDAKAQFKDRRLIVLFFDLSSMEPDEIDHSVTAAENYVDKQMAAADLVSIVSLGNTVTVNQDFTADHDLIKKALAGFNAGGGQGFEAGSTGTTEGTQDTGGSFTADDTEYNIFNADRRLEALRTIAKQLEHVDQKKSLIYFSSGMERTGIENQSELRAAINAAVRANLAIYTIDIRGLQAIVAGGEAQNASLRGTSVYSGQAQLSSYDSNFSSQETLVTLAGDTGGKAFLDSNDFGKVFKGVQDDTSFYYVLGYQSTNPARDGKYRKISVKLNRSDLKLEYRRGYYAPADYQHANKDDRERQLNEELASDLPATDLPLYLSAGYFRVAENKFFIPVSLVVPGSEIPFVSKSDQDKATLDVIGVATDPNKHEVGYIRDTVKLSIEASTQVKQKNVQYNNSFLLIPGTYHVKFVVRENQTGRMGSFETDLTVPDLKPAPLRMSSVVLSSQVQPAGKRVAANDPLVHDGSEIVPSVTHVFAGGQHLYLYYEVYDPGKEKAQPSDKEKDKDKDAKIETGGIRVFSNVAFFQGKVKAYESPLVQITQPTSKDGKTAAFQLDIPLTQLKPGFYTCQVNVVDDAAGHFLFPRLGLLIRQ